MPIYMSLLHHHTRFTSFTPYCSSLKCLPSVSLYTLFPPYHSSLCSIEWRQFVNEVRVVPSCIWRVSQAKAKLLYACVLPLYAFVAITLKSCHRTSQLWQQRAYKFITYINWLIKSSTCKGNITSVAFMQLYIGEPKYFELFHPFLQNIIY